MSEASVPAGLGHSPFRCRPSSSGGCAIVFTTSLRRLRNRRPLRRPGRLLVPAVAFSLIYGVTVASTPASSQPKPAADDSLAEVECLAGGSCGGPPAPSSFESRQPAQRPLCVAEETIKSAPMRLKTEVLAFANSDMVAPCRQAALALAPKRDVMMSALESGSPALLEQSYGKAADDFSAACFTQRKILNHAQVTPAERTFLRDHVGLIVDQTRPARSSAKPVCEAARIGRFIITPEHCLPAAARAQAASGGIIKEIGFRFFDHPTVHSMKIRKLGTDAEPKRESPRDFAVLEIVNAPELDEPVEPLFGTMNLFEDFVVATTSVDLKVLRELNSGQAIDFGTAVQIRSNTICRPAHITRDGIFLHTCFPEGIVNVGAPFFQRQRGRLVLVGFQNGKTSSLPDPTLAACTRGLPNFGVAISLRALN